MSNQPEPKPLVLPDVSIKQVHERYPHFTEDRVTRAIESGRLRAIQECRGAKWFTTWEWVAQWVASWPTSAVRATTRENKAVFKPTPRKSPRQHFKPKYEG